MQGSTNNFPHTIRLHWRPGDKIEDWDTKCIWVIETFGKPGVNYITHATGDFMDFMFKYEKDAIFFSLKCL